MGALKIFGNPWLHPQLLPPQFLWAFGLIDFMNVRTKFEICSFTRSWDNRGYPKKLVSPWICPHSLFSPLKILYSYLTYRLYILYSFPAIFDGSFEWELRTPNLGEGEAVGGRDVIVRKSAGEAVHSNISSIFTRFRYIDVFVLHHAIFPYPTSILPKISPCSRGNRWIAFWLQRAKLLG